MEKADCFVQKGLKSAKLAQDEAPYAGSGYATLSAMPETEAPPASARPENTLSPQETSALQKATREELICPRCEARPLRGEEIVSEIYHGVRLTCPDIHCGFVEY